MAQINPFQAPINYAVDVQSPFEAALGGFKLGAGVAEIQAAQQARERAQTAQTELANLFKNPNATAADYARVTAFLPKDQAATVLSGFEAQTKEQQQSTLRQGTQVYTAIKSGNLPVAEMQLKEQATALRNAGREKEAQGYDDLSNLIRLNPTGAQTTIALTIAGLPGGKEFLDNADKTLSTQRAEALQPSALKEAGAKAEQAVTEAQTKVADLRIKLQNEPIEAERLIIKRDLELAQANEAKVKEKYAEEITLADLKKKAADLGLTNAQTGSALAQTRKLGLESQKAALELEALKATGGVDPEKKFTQEEKIRKEFQGRTKVYGELQGTYNNIKSSADAKTGPGDIALITGFMKMLDPGSVVRETEFATARDTAGLYDRLLNTSQKLQSGQLFTLDSKQRQEYVNLAKQYLDSAQKKAEQEKKDLSIVVKNYKLNPENVFGAEQAPTPPPAPLPTSATVGGKTYPRPASFTDAQWSDYLKANGVIQ
jgi:hypothetical protein